MKESNLNKKKRKFGHYSSVFWPQERIFKQCDACKGEILGDTLVLDSNNNEIDCYIIWDRTIHSVKKVEPVFQIVPKSDFSEDENHHRTYGID